MTDDNKQIAEFLTNSSILSSCSKIELVRLVPYISLLKVEKGEKIFSDEAGAEYFYFIVNGSIELKSEKRQLDLLNEGTFGEESITGRNRYLADAIAVENSILVRIPGKHLSTLLKTNSALKENFFSMLVNHHSYKKLDAKDVIKKERKKESDSIFSIVGWFLAIALPGLILFFGKDLGFNWNSMIFITVSVSTITMWIFRLAHEFIPSILAVLVILILDIAPPSVALSGFTSGSFFMAMSIFGLSAVLVSSGLTYRLVINLLKILPLSQFWHSFAIFFTGLFLTPILPSANGRISMASPILKDMIESLGYKKKGKAATRLSIATFAGFTMFSSIFLSSKAIHFVIFGLLPTQVRDQFNWGYWLYASLIAGGVLFILYSISVGFLFRNDEKPKLSKDEIEAQYTILGPLTKHEWAALGGIILFFVGIVTSSVHKIQLPWIGVTVLYVILALEFLSKKEFKSNIDWTFLIYLGTLIGLVKSMSFIGLDSVLGNQLAWLGGYLVNNFALFVVFLSVSIFIMRIFIPNNASVAILASVLFPIAEISGINPWVVGFIILIMSDAWILPYQSTYYLLFKELIGEAGLYDQKSLLKFNFISILFRLAAVFASIPFWRYLGIL